MVELLKKLTEAARCKVWVSDTMINYVNKFFRIRKLMSTTSVHFFVFLLKCLDFEIVQLFLPFIAPTLALGIPNSWAWFRFPVLDS
jgi:hypothetical protein